MNMKQGADIRNNISIIIPVYNVETYIEQCLHSVISGVQASASQSIEVLIIDDGSTDSSGLLADKITSEHDFIRVIHQTNAGVAAARNCGIMEATGEWLYFVDSDDWLSETAISDISKRIEQYSDADVILFDAYRIWGEAVTLWEHFSKETVWTSEADIAQLSAGALYFPGMKFVTDMPLAAPWDKVFRSSFIKDNHLKFREELKVLDDMVFSYEAFGVAKKVAYCKDKIYYYRYVPTSITNSYKPNRVEQDMLVWKYLENTLKQASGAKSELLKQALNARIVKSFSICCRLCFFNTQNEKSLKQKLKDVKLVLRQAPYSKAFKEVNVFGLEWKLKIMTFMGKHRCALGVYILHLAECLLQKLRR